MPFSCGHHRAFVYERGGVVPVGELTPLQSVRWNRKRDEVSDAEATIGTTECCDLLGDLRTTKHELHIERDGVRVWQGPITRLEYDWNQVRVYAEDMLWVAKRTVLKVGYNHAYPNIGNVLDKMDFLLRSQTYAPNGDPWRMVAHLRPQRHADEPKTTRITDAYSTYVWNEFDYFAEDGGADYTVVGRDIYYWDVNLRWKIIPDLDEQYLSEFPRIVEYGSQAATHAYNSNSAGYAGVAHAPAAVINEWGHIDYLMTSLEDTDDTVPTAAEIAEWTKTAGRNLNGRYPPPLAVLIPANTTMLPGAPWTMTDMVPGAWFRISLTRMCRSVTDWHRLHEVRVEESAPKGETVQFTAVAAPTAIVDPVP